MNRRMINRLCGRVYGWFDSKEAEPRIAGGMARFNGRARLLLQHLEDRVVPATFLVTSTADSGPGTLRDAIDQLNLSSDPANDINFNLSLPATISLSSALPTIAKNVSINGPGQDKLTITKSASGFRLFTVTNSDPTGLVTIQGVTITGASVGLAGGGINVSAGSLTIQNSTISGNTATGGGGAIAMTGTGNLTILNSTIADNSASSYGGGVRAGSGVSVEILGSTFSGNKASSTGYGGGAINSKGAPTFTVRNSTFSGNSTSGSGGAISLRTSPNAVITNSTITGNTSSINFADPGDGGAISMYFYTTGNLTIQSCIVSGNTHTTGGFFDDFSFSSNATVTVADTFYTDNPGGTFTDGGGNLQQPHANVKLQPLANNGGLTKTHAIILGSAAIDKGSNPAALAKDQTGVNDRVIDGGFGLIADMGAFEFTPGIPVATVGGLVNVTADLPGVNNPYTFTVTYDDAVEINFSTIGSDDVEVVRVGGGFSAVATFVSAVPAANAPSITATYKFDPPGGTWDVADNGTYKVNMLANTVKNSASKSVPAGTLGSFVVAFPATFVVTNDNASGPGSLQQAVLDANANPGLDVIVFDATFFSTAKTISLSGSLPNFIEGVTINGPGQSLVTITAPGNRIMSSSIPAAETLKISGVTLSGGSIAGTGGAIDVTSGSLEIQASTLSGNTATGGGGAIAMTGTGKLTILNSTIADNSASSYGGGIRAGSGVSVEILGSTFSGNKASATGYGGGAINSKGAPTFTVRNSTFSGNSTSGSGGAISLRTSPNAVITNSTITGNTASNSFADPGDGGAISMYFYTTGNLTIQSCIVSGNTHTAGGNFDDFSFSSNATVTVADTFYTDNPGGTFTDGGGNLQQPLANVKLQPLANNGGLTKTHAIIFGSAAIDKGSNPAALAKDQTDVNDRVIDGGFGLIADMGAFEFTPGIPVATVGGLVNVTADLPGVNNPYTFTVTYDDAVEINFSTIGSDDVEVVRVGGGFSAVATFVSAVPAANAPSITATYKFDPPGGTWDVADNGTYKVNMLANTVKNSASKSVPAGTLGSFVVAFPLTFVVTNDNASGPGSLQQAVLDSNSNPTPDIIVFDPVFFATAKTISLSSSLLINDAVTINGPGSKLVTVDGGGLLRPFDTSGAATGSLVNLKGLTIANGVAAGAGGGLLIGDEIVTLNDVTITGNSSGANGGGIAMTAPGAKLTINNSTISKNTSSFSSQGGGGISASPSSADNHVVTINNSTIDSNSATGVGGGISFWFSGTLELNNSTVSRNTSNSTVGGGGVYMWGTASKGTISNSTIADNTSSGSGAGVVLNNGISSTQMLIRNSTITGNSTSSTVSTAAGGVASNSSWSLTIVSSVVAENLTGGAAPDISAAVDPLINFSAIGDPNGFTPAPGSGDNLPFTIDLKLSPLGNNGGPTETRLPLAGSPLIDAGDNPAGLTTDQRGLTRVVNGQADIGSVEVQATPLTVTSIEVNGGAPQRSRLTSITVNFSGPVSPGSFTSLGAITLTRTLATPTGTVGTVVQTGATGANGLITVTQPGPTNQLVLTFSNANAAPETAGVEYGSLSDGRWQLAIPSVSYTSPLNDPILRRLFGDFEAGPPGVSNGTVDSSDFSSLGTVFGTSPGVGVSPFDYDNNGTIDAIDFASFGSRFGLSV